MNLQSIRQQRYPVLQFGDGKTLPNQRCWCNQLLRLTTSHSQHNPGRMFLTFAKRIYSFIQRLDLPCSPRILEELDRRCHQMNAYLAQPVPPSIPT